MMQKCIEDDTDVNRAVRHMSGSMLHHADPTQKLSKTINHTQIHGQTSTKLTKRPLPQTTIKCTNDNRPPQTKTKGLKPMSKTKPDIEPKLTSRTNQGVSQ